MKIDTSFIVNAGKRKRIVELQLDDRELLRYVDSLRVTKRIFNETMAREDIMNNNVRILRYGLSHGTDLELESVTLKYGFRFATVAGCVVDSELRKSVELYNHIVYEYLDTINDTGWREEMKKDVWNYIYGFRFKNAR